jgi:hypothetical protein
MKVDAIIGERILASTDAIRCTGWQKKTSKMKKFFAVIFALANDSTSKSESYPKI